MQRGSQQAGSFNPQRTTWLASFCKPAAWSDTAHTAPEHLGAARGGRADADSARGSMGGKQNKTRTSKRMHSLQAYRLQHKGDWRSTAARLAGHGGSHPAAEGDEPQAELRRHSNVSYLAVAAGSAQTPQDFRQQQQQQQRHREHSVRTCSSVCVFASLWFCSSTASDGSALGQL